MKTLAFLFASLFATTVFAASGSFRVSITIVNTCTINHNNSGNAIVETRCTSYQPAPIVSQQPDYQIVTVNNVDVKVKTLDVYF